jgi:hypothetical protein
VKKTKKSGIISKSYGIRDLWVLGGPRGDAWAVRALGLSLEDAEKEARRLLKGIGKGGVVQVFSVVRAVVAEFK